MKGLPPSPPARTGLRRGSPDSTKGRQRRSASPTGRNDSSRSSFLLGDESAGAESIPDCPSSRPPPEGELARYLAALERRYLRGLEFLEVRKGVQALSFLYIERRGKLAPGEAFEGAGKRAAFAFYYGVLHFLLVREIVREVGAGLPPLRRIVDLGCGTLAAGAAWALEEGGQAAVTGADVSAFAVEAARFTLRCLGLRGSVQRDNLLRLRLPGRGAGIVAAFAVNELGGRERERLLGRLLGAARRGARILVVEPLALRANPWWRPWTDRFLAAGGRQDEWRFPMELPGRVALLHRAAGFRREAITGRSLWLAREPSGERPLSG